MKFPCNTLIHGAKQIDSCFTIVSLSKIHFISITKFTQIVCSYSLFSLFVFMIHPLKLQINVMNFIQVAIKFKKNFTLEFNNPSDMVVR